MDLPLLPSFKDIQSQNLSTEYSYVVLFQYLVMFTAKNYFSPSRRIMLGTSIDNSTAFRIN